MTTALAGDQIVQTDGIYDSCDASIVDQASGLRELAGEQQGETAEQFNERIELELIKEEVGSTEIGGDARDEDEAILYRFLRYRGRLLGERDAVEARAERIVKSLDKKLDSLDKFYEPIISDITKRKLAGGKKKSLGTVFGIVGFRATPDRIDVIDANLVPDSFKRIIPPVPAQSVPDKPTILKHFKEKGELPTGCDIVPGGEKFYIKSND